MYIQDDSTYNIVIVTQDDPYTINPINLNSFYKNEKINDRGLREGVPHTLFPAPNLIDFSEYKDDGYLKHVHQTFDF